MSNKPRSWSELKNRRERASSNHGTPKHSTSFHLTQTDSFNDTIKHIDPIIHSFDNFQLLRKTYANLCKLPTQMYRDWIACCQEYISQDIIGNTPQENRENHEVASAFREFEEAYDTLIKDSTIDEEVRSQQVQISLLHLLRSLLSNPNNLTKTILSKSINDDMGE